MRRYKRIVAVVFAVLLVIISVMPAYAAESNTPKEEVVYVNINQDGSVKEIYVVNIFELDEDGRIIDYGEYENLRNMTTTDEIGYSDSKVTIDAEAGKLYYEGKLSTDVMPWDIIVKYYMDGVEYSANEIAGKSGALKITMSIRKNKKCNPVFFEGYALQATLVLDTEKCKDIAADGATVANVGSDKQLTYTILPNKEKDIEITANVKNFEMDGISINGVRLNLDIEIDDSELQDKIDDIIRAVDELDDGAGSLYTGTNDLYKGARKLYDGATALNKGTGTLSGGTGRLYSATGTLNEKVGELYTGVGNLSAGADSLYNGLTVLSGKNEELANAAWSAYAALCTAAQTQLNEELTANGLDEVTLTPDNYSTVLMDILSKLDADTVYKQAYEKALQEVTAQVEANVEELYKSYILSQADAIYYQYILSQADTLYTQVAIQTVYAKLLEEGYSETEAQEYLQTQAGQALIAQTLAAMSDEQKEQIITTAVGQLTDEQKQQILQGALEDLTDEQKAQIRNAYIEKMMASEEVTQKISAAVAKVSEAAAKVTELKGQLDSYGLFYKGLLSYTAGVSDAANGANALQSGLASLYSNTNTLKQATLELHTATGELSGGAIELKNGATELNNGARELLDGAGKLNDGAAEMSEGTGEFVDETSGMNEEVNDEIDSLISSISGDDVEVVSFVSEKNTNIKSVQFVIKTDSIQVEENETDENNKEETLNFWQKLLRLFGIEQ